MKKKYLILLLASLSSFASGEFKFEFVPKVNVDKDKNTKHEYVLPYKVDVNFDEQNISIGIDGKYNKGTKLGEFEFLKNEMNIWGKYDILGDVHSGYVRIDNDITSKYTTKFEGSISTKLSGRYQYIINDMLKYNLDIAYRGNTLIANPEYLEAKNKLIIDGGYEAYVNLKQNLKGKIAKFDKSGYVFSKESIKAKEFTSQDDEFTSNTVLTIGGKVSKKGFTFEPSYALDIVYGKGFVAKEVISAKNDIDTKLEELENKKATYTKNTLKLNLGYSKDFEVIKLNVEFNNKIDFEILNSQLVFRELVEQDDATLKDESYKTLYEINPKFVLSRNFDKGIVNVTPKLIIEGKTLFAFGAKYNYIKESSLTINPSLDLKVQIVESIHFISNIDLGFNFKQNKLQKLGIDKNDFGFSDFNLKLSLGLQYNW